MVPIFVPHKWQKLVSRCSSTYLRLEPHSIEMRWFLMLQLFLWLISHFWDYLPLLTSIWSDKLQMFNWISLWLTMTKYKLFCFGEKMLFLLDVCSVPPGGGGYLPHWYTGMCVWKVKSRPKTWVHQKLISEILMNDANLLPKIWVPDFVFKTKIPSELAQNVLYKVIDEFKPS